MRLIVVSGLSGSGKSVALDMLEDLDFYCVDNMPAGLLPGFIAYTVRTSESSYRETAVGVDARNRPRGPGRGAAAGGDPAQERHQLRNPVPAGGQRDAAEAVQRDTPPASAQPAGRRLKEALAQEQRLLVPLANAADLTIDTSRLSVHELRELIRGRVVDRAQSGPSLLFQSFAYRHGVPDDADFVFDARALPNPYWDPALRDLTGRDEPVARFLGQQDEVNRFCEDIRDFIARWLPSLVRSNRSYLTIAVGCTGGQHRSVYLAERLAAHFRESQGTALVRHRDLASRQHE